MVRERESGFKDVESVKRRIRENEKESRLASFARPPFVVLELSFCAPGLGVSVG